MSKILKRSAVILTTSLLLVLLVGCNLIGGKQFGMFKAGKHKLKSFANKDLTYAEASSKISSYNNLSFNDQELYINTDKRERPEVDEEFARRFISKYRGVEVTYKFYDIKNKKVEEKFSFDGRDFSQFIIDGEIRLFVGMNITDIFMNKEVLDYYESENVHFKNDNTNEYKPFHNIYSYHEGSGKRFVLQVHDFVDLPNSAGYASGYSSTYIKENETVYNEFGIITEFQSSLGIKIQYPNRTGLYGTIFNATFDWVEKF